LLGLDGAVRIPDLGTFLVFHKKARTGVNPRTGKKMKIPASNVPRFKASRSLKQHEHTPPDRVKTRFSNLYKRLRHDFLEDFSRYRSLSSTLKHYGGVKSDAKMTPTTARRIRGIRSPVFSLKHR